MYQVIYADPPWFYRNRKPGGEPHVRCRAALPDPQAVGGRHAVRALARHDAGPSSGSIRANR